MNGLAGLIKVLRWHRVSLALQLLLLTGSVVAALIIYDGLSDDLERADVALVLGNKVDPGGKPSRGLKARLDRALEVYQGGLVSWIIVSGGTGKEGFDEAKVMACYLVNHGIPAWRIVVDSYGINTEASAINTARIMNERGWRSAMVVSQYFHISRSKMALKKAGVEEVHSAHAYLFDWRDLYSIVREVLGYGSYCFREFAQPD